MATIDGAATRGKTKGENPKLDGPSVGVQTGGKGSKGVSNEGLKALGRGLARIKNQTGGK